MEKSCLIIIDMLNDFVLEGAPLEVPSTRNIISYLKKEIEKARNLKIPVIYVCDSHKKDDKEFKKFGWPPHAIEGTKGAKIIDELKPKRGDKIFKKKTYSAFYKTRLESFLKKEKIKKLYLGGCVTHICVMFSASDAVLRGYDVFVLEKGVAGLAKEDHEAGLKIMKNVLGVKIVEGI